MMAIRYRSDPGGVIHPAPSDENAYVPLRLLSTTSLFVDEIFLFLFNTIHSAFVVLYFLFFRDVVVGSDHHGGILEGSVIMDRVPENPGPLEVVLVGTLGEVVAIQVGFETAAEPPGT